MHLIADGIRIVPGCGDQEVKRLHPCIAGALQHDVKQLSVRLRVQLIKNNAVGIETVLVRHICRQHLVGTVGGQIGYLFLRLQYLHALGKCRADFLNTLQTNIATMVKQGDALSPEVIDERLRELQKELVKKANQKADYDAIADEIFRLRDQKEQSEVDSHHREEAMNRIKELQDFIAGQETDITEFDEALVKKLIEKITVFADHFTVEFKSGITIDIED